MRLWSKKSATSLRDAQHTDEETLGMLPQDHTESVPSLKSRGKKPVKDHFDAIDSITRAVALSPTPELYFERAIAHVNTPNPRYDLVINDCTTALSLDSSFLAPLNLRGVAHEALSQLPEALRDFTASTFLSRCTTQSETESIRRVLSNLARGKAQKLLEQRRPQLPSTSRMTSYFASFRPTPRPILSAEPSHRPGDPILLRALDAIDAADYSLATKLTSEALSRQLSTPLLQSIALNLCGTFRSFIGDTHAAKSLFAASSEAYPEFTQSFVKLAYELFATGMVADAFEALDEAMMRNPLDPDIYHHRGQLLCMTNDFTSAIRDYEKSIKLDAHFLPSHTQLAVALHRSSFTDRATAELQAAMRKHPHASQLHHEYAKILSDEGRYAAAVASFAKAAELERVKGARQDLTALVGKGIALYRWKKDALAAEWACSEALALDDRCEVAIDTLAQLRISQGRLEEAIELYDRKASIARSTSGLMNALTYRYACSTQMDVKERWPGLTAYMGSGTVDWMIGMAQCHSMVEVVEIK